MRLTDEEFRLISQLVYSHFGIHLPEQKRTLVTERLQKTVFEGGFASFKDYYNHVVEDVTNTALLHLVDRLSTNHTYFFRERDHLDFLGKVVLPEIEAAARKTGNKELRIWSAGCSSGEEVYSLAMVVGEFFGLNAAGWDAGILGTDISTSVLASASAGLYREDQLAQVPPLLRSSCFKRLGNGVYSVVPDLRKLVLFRRLNLVNAVYPFQGKFHVVFCRNVMIYFDEKTRMEQLERFHRYLAPGGYLFLGHSESIERGHPLYRYVRPSVYQSR